MEGTRDGTVYKVDSSLERVDDLKSIITNAFAASDSVGLVTYEVDIRPAGDARNIRRSPSGPQNSKIDSNGVMLVAARAQPDEESDTATTTDSADSSSAKPDVAARPNVQGFVFSEAIVELGIEGSESGAMLNGKALLAELESAAKQAGVPLSARGIELKPYGDGSEEWKSDSSLPFSKWKVKMPLAAAEADQVMEQIKKSLGSDPVWISSSSVGGQVAGDMIGRALGALFASLLCIIGYIWFRFQRVIYGFAAVAALLHDVLITLGAIAISYWLADALGFLLIDPFKISLTVVAALLTIIGYSLNDTIVVFDRIRETKGKAPQADRRNGEHKHQSDAEPNVVDIDHDVNRGRAAVCLWWRGDPRVCVRVGGRRGRWYLQFGVCGEPHFALVDRSQGQARVGVSRVG